MRNSDYDAHPSTEKKAPGSYNRPWRNSVVGTEKRDYSPLAAGQLKKLAHGTSAQDIARGSPDRKNRNEGGPDSKTLDGHSTEEKAKKPKVDYLSELR